MRALHEKVNIVPILAKADSLTPAEVHKKKMKVQELGTRNVPSCDVPCWDCDILYEVLILIYALLGLLILCICVFVHRSERRLNTLGLISTSSQSVTLMRTRTSNSRTSCSR